MARKREGKHSITFWLSIIGVFTLMIAYAWFMSAWLGGSTKENDIYEAYYSRAEGLYDKIAELSEYEIGLYSGDNGTHDIPAEGEKQELRDEVLKTSYAAVTYISGVTGKRCARYKYSREGIGYVMIYDPDDITAHFSENEATLVKEHIALIRSEEDIQ